MNKDSPPKEPVERPAHTPVSPRRLSNAINRFGIQAEISSALRNETSVTPWKAGPVGRQKWPAKILISDYNVSPANSSGNGQNLGQVTQAQALIITTCAAVFDNASEVCVQGVHWQILSYLLLAKTGDRAIYQLTLLQRPALR